MHAHHGHHAPGITPGLGLLVFLCVLTLGLYLTALAVPKEHPRPWRRRRTASFLIGMAMVLAALLPPLAPLAHHSLGAHMLQHLLLGMLGPVGLVLGAPLTLALRTLPTRKARKLIRLLRSRPLHVLSHPLTALMLNLGGMAVLYLTPLYAAMAHRPWLHTLVHWHFLAAGLLFSWSIAGVDPAPNRPSHRVRLTVLFVAMAGHATLSKAMYAYGLPLGTAEPLTAREGAAKLMYYGGDLSELLLAVALFATWPWARATSRGAAPPPAPAKVTTGA
jgi:putative membrane protein